MRRGRAPPERTRQSARHEQDEHDKEEAEQIVRHLAAVADTYDDRLVKEFGGTRASDAKVAG